MMDDNSDEDSDDDNSDEDYVPGWCDFFLKTSSSVVWLILISFSRRRDVFPKEE